MQNKNDLEKRSMTLHFWAMAINAVSLVAGILLVFFGGEAGPFWVHAGILLVAGGTLAFLLVERWAIQIDRRLVDVTPSTNGGIGGVAIPTPQYLTFEPGRLRIHYD